MTVGLALFLDLMMWQLMAQSHQITKHALSRNCGQGQICSNISSQCSALQSCYSLRWCSVKLCGLIDSIVVAWIFWYRLCYVDNCHAGDHSQESPPIGGAVRNATSLIPQRLSSIILAITCSENVHPWPCIDSRERVDRDNNTTPVIYVIHRSITKNRNQPST